MDETVNGKDHDSAGNISESEILPAQKESFKYYAFISYSHKDQKIARKLQRRLQNYHLPSKVMQSHPEVPKKLSPIFIDESYLVAKKGTLSESLRDYLRDSQYLILICSPYSAKSEYVNDEVDYFINELGRADHIIPLIVDGLPHSKDPSTECFVPAIRALPRELEPLGIDLKTFGIRESFLRVMATLMRLDIDYFISREDEERKRRIKKFSSLAAALVLLVGMLVWYGIERMNKRVSDALVQLERGNIYFLNNKDYVQAKEWYEKAADNGNTQAEYFLGYMYQEGLGVEKNYSKAREHYEKAAADGIVGAQNNLAYMYIHGLGVEKDYAKAIEWYEKAAAAGNAQAQHSLGIMYQNGEGVEQDYSKAAEWYKKAADNGNPNAQGSLAYMYAYGYGVEKDQAKAIEWLKKAAEGGNVHAQNNLGVMYEKGSGVEQDYTKAMEWYKKAADNGNSAAKENFERLSLVISQNSEKTAE